MEKSKRIAVILAGNGVFDGSEIHEATFTLYGIARNGGTYEIFAPDITQHHVIDHISGEEMSEERNVLVESARIARGKIKALSELQVENFDAIIFPGGFGVAKNLCSFAFDGVDCYVNEEIKNVIIAFHQAGKPIGALCISPVLIAKVLGEVEVSIGSDKATAEAIESMGAKHSITSYEDVLVDKKNKIFTTPCYMLDATIVQIAEGANNICKAILES